MEGFLRSGYVGTCGIYANAGLSQLHRKLNELHLRPMRVQAYISLDPQQSETNSFSLKTHNENAYFKLWSRRFRLSSTLKRPKPLM